MILIGCPIWDRAWILPQWFTYIENQTYPLNQLGFLFVGSSKDQATIEALFEFQTKHPELPYFNLVYADQLEHQSHPDYEGRLYHRRWNNKGALERMVILRNILLDHVRVIQPHKFFSLDSDILLTDTLTIEALDGLSDAYDAVSILMYMSDTKDFPNVMTWTSLGSEFNGMPMARRDPNGYPLGQLFKADVIMAAKMMSRPVYQNVDYTMHSKGEDLGWSWQCKKKGYQLWNESSIYSSHILSRKMLEIYNVFGDDRYENSDTCIKSPTICTRLP